DTVIVTRIETDPLSESEPPPVDSGDSSPAAGGGPSSSVPNTPNIASAAENGSPSNPANGQEASDLVPPPVANTITVNLSRIFETGDTSGNLVLQPGDVVTVPHAGIVYALGAVTRPGGFVVSNDRGQLTTLKLLALAGGLERTAKSDRAVIVRHDSNGQQHEVEVDLKKVMKFEAEDIRLQPSDILYIPKSAAKQALIKAAELSIAIGSAVAIYRIVR